MGGWGVGRVAGGQGRGGGGGAFDASERATKTMGTQEALTTVSHAASSGAWAKV